jgi:putative DNA primase/helicase
MPGTSFDRFRDALEAAGSKIAVQRSSHIQAQCPHHDDKDPSLSVDYKGDKVMVLCHAGCGTDDVCAALGLELADLFDEPISTNGRAANPRDATYVRSYVYETAGGKPYIVKDRFYPKTFLQRLPDKPVGDRSGLQGRVPILYHLPRLNRALNTKGQYPTIWLVDGEKDVEALERHGCIATCTIGGWRPEYAERFVGAGEVIIVADQDMPKPDGSLGAGQQFAQDARTGLRAVGVSCRIVAPAKGKDTSDHFAAGYGLDDFLPEPTAFTRPRGMVASELMEVDFEPLQWAVNGLVCAGLTICAGAPKGGKSWLWLDAALAVASDAPSARAWGGLSVVQGSVLYLAREDSLRRVQSRLSLLMGGTMKAPAALEVIPSDQDWAGGEQGLANMTEWAEECGNPRMVVLDTLARVEPDLGESRDRGTYAGNYVMMARYKQWADAHNCAVVMVHHDTKAKVEEHTDPFSRISGTRGLTGAADTLMFLDTKRGEATATLHVAGRDVVEQALEMRRVGPCWQAWSGVETY